MATKRAIAVFILMLSLLYSAGCSGNDASDAEENSLGNPATEYCIEQGGSPKTVQTEGGVAGICVLPDNTECDEWAYFRKECP